ncbi:hypothetical protein FVER14953_20171 [Fusarium verticillioides]|nr:hypothetical protein FVER14953_20171 [Fusarium verticillioides]
MISPVNRELWRVSERWIDAVMPWVLGMCPQEYPRPARSRELGVIWPSETIHMWYPLRLPDNCVTKALLCI